MLSATEFSICIISLLIVIFFPEGLNEACRERYDVVPLA